MTRAQCRTCRCDEPCDAAERDAEAERDADEFLPSDADWLAGRSEGRMNR